MKSKFRIATVIFSLGLLSAFGFFDHALIKLMIENQDYGIWKISGLVLITGLIISGLMAIYQLTKIIEFTDNSIEIKWLFRSKHLSYEYKDVVGFRWGTLSGPANYKQIILFLRDRKTIGFSDFEYSNFYELERWVTSQFSVFRSYQKRPTQKQIEEAYLYSHGLDLEQIKVIKWLIYAFWALSFFVARGVIEEYQQSGSISEGRIWITIGYVVLLIYTIIKYFREEKRRKRIKVVHNTTYPPSSGMMS